jgi:hypothetical protein
VSAVSKFPKGLDQTGDLALHAVDVQPQLHRFTQG